MPLVTGTLLDANIGATDTTSDIFKISTADLVVLAVTASGAVTATDITITWEASLDGVNWGTYVAGAAIGTVSGTVLIKQTYVAPGFIRIKAKTDAGTCDVVIKALAK